MALLPDCMGEQTVGKVLHLTVKPPTWWRTQLMEAGFTEIRPLVEVDQTTRQELWFHAFMNTGGARSLTPQARGGVQSSA